jgi:hypothetical protein
MSVQQQLQGGRRPALTALPTQSFRCSNCGYGAVLRADPPPCPMCRETAWEQDAWRPFRHLHDFWHGNGPVPPSAAG